MLALEEVCLGWVGMGRYALADKDYKPSNGYSNVNTLTLHALAHAVDPGLGKSLEFLNPSGRQIAIQDIENAYSESMVTNIQTLVDKLDQKDLNVIVKDLTTSDVDEAGFKVIRAVVPGMQPLDVDHTRRYFGGTRLYEVPHKMGLRNQPLTEDEVNPYPHMFP
jgi:ribosomal protein S12 methylthiotransferase accessory factor